MCWCTALVAAPVAAAGEEAPSGQRPPREAKRSGRRSPSPEAAGRASPPRTTSSNRKPLIFFMCRGEVEDKIFSPWLKSLELKSLKFLANRVPTSLTINKDTECISGIVCGEEVYEADAFVLAMGLSPLQSIIKSSFDDSSGWTFFDLISIYDDYTDEPIAVMEAEFYNASHLLPLNDEHIVSEASSDLIKCIQDFEGATVIQQLVRRSPRSVIHILPGSYKYTSARINFLSKFVYCR